MPNRIALQQHDGPWHAAFEYQHFIRPQIRDRLANLARVIQAGDASVEACSSAVKVRLSRADGSVVEKQGCRGSTNWSQVVSEFTAEWIKVSGMHVVQSREPASTPGSGATHSGHETQAEAHDVPPNG